MTARQYLGRIKWYDNLIQQKREELDYLYNLATSTGTRQLKADMVQTSVDGDKVGRAIDRYVDLEREIETMTSKFVREKNKIINQIQHIPDSRYEEILYLKYVKYYRLEQVACIMRKSNGQPYSFDHIAALHVKALKSFEKNVNLKEIP
jgi:hypothetical protein